MGAVGCGRLWWCSDRLVFGEGKAAVELALRSLWMWWLGGEGGRRRECNADREPLGSTSRPAPSTAAADTSKQTAGHRAAAKRTSLQGGPRLRTATRPSKPAKRRRVRSPALLSPLPNSMVAAEADTGGCGFSGDAEAAAPSLAPPLPPTPPQPRPDSSARARPLPEPSHQPEQRSQASLPEQQATPGPRPVSPGAPTSPRQASLGQPATPNPAPSAPAPQPGQEPEPSPLFADAPPRLPAPLATSGSLARWPSGIPASPHSARAATPGHAGPAQPGPWASPRSPSCATAAAAGGAPLVAAVGGAPLAAAAGVGLAASRLTLAQRTRSGAAAMAEAAAALRGAGSGGPLAVAGGPQAGSGAEEGGAGSGDEEDSCRVRPRPREPRPRRRAGRCCGVVRSRRSRPIPAHAAAMQRWLCATLLRRCAWSRCRRRSCAPALRCA